MRYKGREIHPYESFYWNDSPAFHRGELGGGIARSVKCDDSLATMVEEIIGPTTLPNKGGGGVLEYTNFICLGEQNNSYNRVWKINGYCGALNCTKQMGILEPTNMAMRGREPSVLTPKRTEFGKAIRKKYESHEIEMSRHDMTTMEPRTDGVSNTLTSVQKDNYLAIPCQQGVVEQENNVRYRIRKLTPRECFRLMGVDDADIDKLMNASISNSQLYKCAGNSIVVDVLYHLFRKLFVDKGCEQENFQQTLF